MKRLLLSIGFALALTMGAPGFAPAFAQEPPPSNEGAFDALSSGNQKIVNSIYDSHLDTGSVSLTKDDIAALKADTGWGNAYKQLLANDPALVTHKNLGQAISSYNHQNSPSVTVVTTGTGQQIVTGNKKGKGSGAPSLEGGSSGSQGAGKKFGAHKNTVITTGAGGTLGAGAAAHSTAGGASFGGAGGSKGRGRGGGSHRGK